jgi:hypothetical protein
MRTSASWVTVVLLAGCGELRELLPEAEDGGWAHVPGTYHDAQRSPGHRAHLQLEGDKQLFCRDCHFISDAGFNANAVKPCSDCHLKQQEHHHPFDGGLAMSCFTCHAFRDASAEKWGCGGCHVRAHPGAPHVSVHTDKCESCHRPHGTPFTKAADCGQCHEVRVSHGKGEKALPADTCMTCHPHHTPASVALGQCKSCHLSSAVPPKAQVKPGALFVNADGRGHAGCSTCHTPHTFTATSAKSCSSCHAAKPVIAAEEHVACITCHRPHEERAAPKSCESCHKQMASHLQHPRDVEGHSCIGCHPPHAPSVRASPAVPCLTCHQKQAAPVVHAVATGCRACHKDPHLGKPQRAALCITCHEKQLALVKLNRGHAQQQCDGCHAGLPHSGPIDPTPCLTCHEKKLPPQKGHQEQLQCSSCHQSHSATVTKKCTECHNTPAAPLPGLHRVSKHQQCSKCHAPHTPEPGAGPQTCKGCHTQLSPKSHPTPPQQCVSCHLFTRAP